MRFIHTADWHLGRLFHGVHLTDDQRYVLGQLVELARAERPDAILVAGDIYDRAVPPPEAVELLDEVLCRLVLDLKIPVVLIAGNHDSPNRLNFAARLLADRRLYVVGNLPARCDPIVLHDDAGPVHVYAVPYAEPAVVRQCLQCDGITDHNSAMGKLLEAIRGAHPGNTRAVLLAHAFVAGARECESERPLSVGGAGSVECSCFAGFNYVALGHLHSPQSVNGDGIRYCGSLLKYSFDESAQAKGVYLIDMDADGRCAAKLIALSPRRDVRRIEGRMAALLDAPTDGKSKEDYLEVMLLDEGPVLDAIGRLREVYPNVLSIQRPTTNGTATSSDRPNVRAMDDRELFGAFFKLVSGEELSEEQGKAFASIVDEMRRQEREAPA